jgi:hypothetical protein
MISAFRPWMMLPTTLFAHFLFRLFPRKVGKKSFAWFKD